EPTLNCGGAVYPRVLRNDNTGFTVARWASVRRADPVGVVGKQPVLGEWPAWMLSPRGGGLTQLSRPELAPTFPDFTSLSVEDFVDVCSSGQPISSVDTRVQPKPDFEIHPSLRMLYDQS